MDISQLSLPSQYLVTPALANKSRIAEFIHQIEKSLIAGTDLVQLPGITLDPMLYKTLLTLDADFVTYHPYFPRQVIQKQSSWAGKILPFLLSKSNFLFMHSME